MTLFYAGVLYTDRLTGINDFHRYLCLSHAEGDCLVASRDEETNTALKQAFEKQLHFHTKDITIVSRMLLGYPSTVGETLSLVQNLDKDESKLIVNERLYEVDTNKLIEI